MTLAKSKTKAYTEAEKKRDVIGKGDAVVIIGAGALPLQLRLCKASAPGEGPAAVRTRAARPCHARSCYQWAVAFAMPIVACSSAAARRAYARANFTPGSEDDLAVRGPRPPKKAASPR